MLHCGLASLLFKQAPIQISSKVDLDKPVKTSQINKHIEIRTHKISILSLNPWEKHSWTQNFVHEHFEVIQQDFRDCSLLGETNTTRTDTKLGSNHIGTLSNIKHLQISLFYRLASNTEKCNAASFLMPTSSSVIGLLPSFITNPEYPVGMLRTHPFRPRPLKDALRARNWVKMPISNNTIIYQSVSLTL